MGIIRPRILLTAALDGRATFLVAGAVLGVGVYGFATTFKPYDSGRVLQPFPILEPVVATIHGPMFEPPSAVLPEAVAPVESVSPIAPGDVLVSVPRPARIAPVESGPPPVQAAADGGVTPLEPVPTTPEPARREIPPVVIAPENVLVYIHPGWSWRDDPKDSDDRRHDDDDSPEEGDGSDRIPRHRDSRNSSDSGNE